MRGVNLSSEMMFFVFGNGTVTQDVFSSNYPRFSNASLLGLNSVVMVAVTMFLAGLTFIQILRKCNYSCATCKISSNGTCARLQNFHPRFYQDAKKKRLPAWKVLEGVRI